MSAPGKQSSDALRQPLTLVGSGEPLLRLEKRMGCAAAGLGLKLNFDVRRDHEAFGLAYADTSAVLLGGQLVFSELPRTETLEAWLRNITAAIPDTADGKDSPGNPLQT
jgi:hypothetical protein